MRQKHASLFLLFLLLLGNVCGASSSQESNESISAPTTAPKKRLRRRIRRERNQPESSTRSIKRRDVSSLYQKATARETVAIRKRMRRSTLRQRSLREEGGTTRQRKTRETVRDARQAPGRRPKGANYRKKNVAAKPVRATTGAGLSGDEEALALILSASSSQDTTDENARKKKEDKKNEGFLDLALLSLVVGGSATAGATLGAGGMAGILCATGGICGTQPPTEIITVQTSGDIIFRGLPRAPTQEENEGVAVQISAWYTEVIAQQLGATIASPGRQAETEMTTPTQFLNYTVSSVSITAPPDDDTTQWNLMSTECILSQLGFSSYRVSPGARVDTQVTDFAIQRADPEVFVRDFLPNAQPDSSVYRTITDVSMITIRSTTTPVPSTTPSVAPSLQISSIPSISSSFSNTETIFPTATSSGSLGPSFLSPSFMPAVSTSSPTVAELTTRFVSARLSYGFFGGTTIREATTEEINGLVVQTQNFYTDIFRAAYPTSFSSFSMSNVVQTFTSTTNLPIIIDFDAAVVFTTDSANTPTEAQVFSTMQNTNYDNYVMDYVWNSEPPDTIFFDTQRVTFGESGGLVPSTSPSVTGVTSLPTDAGVTSLPTAAGPTARLVSARLSYGFFGGTTIREATAEEINGLVVQTQNFYTDILRAAYPNSFSNFGMSNAVQTFDASADFPIALDFDSTVTFSTPEGNTPTAAQVFTRMQNANYEEYIQNYVWTLTGTIFFDTQQVAFAARGGLVAALIEDPKTWLAAAWIAPTSSPSARPTVLPSQEPSISKAPSKQPSVAPSDKPSKAPSDHPSFSPSATLSAVPTIPAAPSADPSPSPSDVPSQKPSREPTKTPTSIPSENPSRTATSIKTPTEATTAKFNFPTRAPTILSPGPATESSLFLPEKTNDVVLASSSVERSPKPPFLQLEPIGTTVTRPPKPTSPATTKNPGIWVEEEEHFDFEDSQDSRIVWLSEDD